MLTWVALALLSAVLLLAGFSLLAENDVGGMFFILLGVLAAGASFMIRYAKPSAGSAMDELEKLTRLRDSGALTPEEFEAKKAKLIGRI